MDPIVSPWLIYLISVINSIRIFAFILGLSFSIPLLIYFVSDFFNYINEDILFPYQLDQYEELKKRNSKQIKKYFILCLTFILVGLLIPSKETLITMLIANVITPDNINMSNELIKHNVQDYVNIIVDGINKTK